MARPTCSPIFEPADAQRVYACFDQPDLKACFGLTVTLPERWRAVSNIPFAEETVEGESKTVRFEQSPRMSTFITALCVGPFHEVRAKHDGLDLGLVCRASMAMHLDSEELFALTGAAVRPLPRALRSPLPAAQV